LILNCFCTCLGRAKRLIAYVWHCCKEGVNFA
jgi:hypothetical protein